MRRSFCSSRSVYVIQTSSTRSNHRASISTAASTTITFLTVKEPCSAACTAMSAPILSIRSSISVRIAGHTISFKASISALSLYTFPPNTLRSISPPSPTSSSPKCSTSLLKHSVPAYVMTSFDSCWIQDNGFTWQICFMPELVRVDHSCAFILEIV